MTEIQDVTGTAFIVAEYRARENAEQNPLYRDPIVPRFLSERTRQAADRVAANFPPGVQGVILRTRYFDDRLDEQLSRGCRQVVIPGAGLDTRGVRKQAPGVTYFEHLFKGGSGIGEHTPQRLFDSLRKNSFKPKCACVLPLTPSSERGIAWCVERGMRRARERRRAAAIFRDGVAPRES
jgi:hypothetical protein